MFCDYYLVFFVINIFGCIGGLVNFFISNFIDFFYGVFVWFFISNVISLVIGNKLRIFCNIYFDVIFIVCCFFLSY